MAVWCRRCQIPYTPQEARAGTCAACGEALPVPAGAVSAERQPVRSDGITERDEGGSEVVWCRPCRIPYTLDEAKAGKCPVCGTAFFEPPAGRTVAPLPRRRTPVTPVVLVLGGLVVCTALAGAAWLLFLKPPAESTP